MDAHYLAQALFGILMLLPQTEAFNLLRNRLQCVPNYWGQNIERSTKLSVEKQSTIDFLELIKHFERVQNIHQQQRIAHRKKSIQLWENK